MNTQPHRRRCHPGAFLLLSAAVAILLPPGSTTQAVETIKDSTYGFKLDLPDGFTRIEDLSLVTPDSVHAFLYGKAEDGKLNTLLLIEKTGNLLAHQRLERADLPPDFKGRLLRITWQGLELGMVEIPEETQGMKALTYSVGIPLKREAIRLKLFGPAERQKELKALFDQVLAGLSGESSWSTSPTAAKSQPSSATPLLVGAAASFLAILIVLWAISKKAPRGTVLGLAVLLLVGSADPGQNASAIAHMASGVLRLSGIAGLILGLADLCRKSRPSKSTQ